MGIFYIIHPAALGPPDYSTSSRNEYQKKKMMLLRKRAHRVRKAHNLNSIYEPTVKTIRDDQYLTAL
jgi:hypothetical protein